VKRWVPLLLTALILLTACNTEMPENNTATSSEEQSETENPADMNEIQHAVGNVGHVSVKAEDADLTFETEHLSFTMLNTLAAGMKNGVGTALLSKSGTITVIDKSDSAMVIESRWKGNDTVLTTDLSIAPQAVTVRQTVTASKGGIAGTSFTLRVPDTYHVILPVQNGIRLTKEAPYAYNGRMGTRFEYGGNNAIQMQMLILEGENGGVLLYAEDVYTQYKAFDVKHSGNSFTITVESIPQAPFTDKTVYATIPWKIIPYEGDWTSASALYRDYAREAFDLAEADTRRPAWVDDIAIVVQADLRDTKKLDAIAANLDPSRVLLQVSNFRTNLYDVNWPDYTVAPDFKQYIDYAHKLGFKVQLHVNMHGCHTELDVYQQFKQYRMVHALTGKGYGEDFTDANGNYFNFAHINPASSEWRQYIIEQLVRVVEETDADSLHLDQSLLAYNDGNGLIDGLTSLQGNALYHKELLEALPDDVVLGGEGINDFNAVYATFLQSHLYGMDTAKKTLIPLDSAQIVPITASVFTDVITYQHPAVPTVATGDYYLGWYRNGTAIGHIPTLYRESASSIAGENAIMEMVLQEAKWYMENRPVRVYSEWDRNTVARWQLKDGTFARAKYDAYGYVLLGNEEDESSVVSRLVFGVSEAKVSGYIDGCFAYNEEYYYALDPNNHYVVRHRERPQDTTHITAITAGVVIEQWTRQDGYDQISLSAKDPAVKTVNLTLYCRETITNVHCRSGRVTWKTVGDHLYEISLPVGETLYLIRKDGTAASLPINLYSQTPTTYYVDVDGNFTITDTTAKATGSFAGQLRKKITVKVPAKRMNSLEYIVSLPDKDNMKLNLMVGSPSRLFANLPVQIVINGEMVWSGTITESNTVTDISLDLSAYKGQVIFLSLQADGRSLDGATKEVVWVNPVIKSIS